MSLLIFLIFLALLLGFVLFFFLSIYSYPRFFLTYLSHLCTRELCVPGASQTHHAQNEIPFFSGNLNHMWRSAITGRILEFFEKVIA